jgi:aminocarboxymuconate-semialdehyde decarboxylase
MMTAKRVEVHSHTLLEDIFGGAGKYGPELIMEPNGTHSIRIGNLKLPRPARPDPRASDPAVCVADMDSKGVDAMGVTSSPLLYLYWAEREIGIEFNRVLNDALARYCSPYPDRLFFMANLPMQAPEACVAEVDRAIGLGARGIHLGAFNLGGRQLGDEAFWPIYDCIQSHDVPIFIHGYPPHFASSEPPARRKLAPATDGPQGEGTLTEAWGLEPYEMPDAIEVPIQGTVAVTHLMFGGVFDAFPNLKVIISYGGGTVPYQFGRMQMAASRTRGVKAKRPLREYLRNLYFDTLVYDVEAREFLVKFMGVDNLMVGSNYLSWGAPDGFAFIEELKLSKADEDRIMGENASRLFKLAQPQPDAVAR